MNKESKQIRDLIDYYHTLREQVREDLLKAGDRDGRLVCLTIYDTLAGVLEMLDVTRLELAKKEDHGKD